jgi:gentisate 1,2-dioxygenase
MREDILGRANVEDTPELLAYYEELAKHEAAALWTVANSIEPWFPKSESVPTLWRFQDLRELVLKSVELVSPEKAGRRVVMLNNPNRKHVSACVGWLYSGLQVMKPGEEAMAHRHSASALRFIMEGSGAFTVVEGQKMSLGARDFVLTPNGTWHQHGVAETGEWCIWQDGLDIPFINAMEAGFYEVHPELFQKNSRPVDEYVKVFSGSGVLPVNFDWQHKYAPLYKFQWEKTYEALLQYASVSDGDPYDGIILRYINPLTGGDVMQTMGAAMQMLRPAEHTKAHRHTGSIMYQVAKGKGYSVINGKRYDWQEKDIFCVPSWAVHEHINLDEKEDACLFQFNDLPVINATGLYREQAWADNDGYQTIIA